MGVFHPTRVTCTCGHAFVVNLARSVNAVRMPALRNLILSGAFHRVSCPSCGRRVAVESPLYYTDLRRGAVFHVRPRNERYQYEQDSARLQRVAASLPGELGENGHRQLRVIYGLDELREKLVAQDAGLDDRMVELVKVMLLQEHPFLMNKPRLLVHLQKVSRQSFDFIVYHHHESQGHYVSLPRPAVQEALASPATAREWMKRAGLRANLFELPDHWVNFRRWTTRYSSLDALRRFASDRETGLKVDLGSREFRRMVERLPRGSQLPGWAKRDLGALFEYARDHRLGPAQEALFEVRFGIELEDE